MKTKLAVRSSVLFMFAALAFITAFGLLSCSDALPVTNFPVTVTWNGAAAGSRWLSDGDVSSVAILVYNATGKRIGSGTLVNAGTFWSGKITVEEIGVAVFEINALDSFGNVLYVGRITQMLNGTGDIVTIISGAASLKGGSIQGYVPTLSTMVNTFAGSSTAGTGVTSPLIGVAALFVNPYGMTTDGTNIYLADMGSNNIRKIVIATQSVSTFAGQTTGGADITDAVGIGAAFTNPRGITTDGTNLYIADYGANTIRKIVIGTQTVSHFAGTDGLIAGFTDGTGNAATFHSPSGITYFNGFLYVADTANNRIRKIEVSTKIVTTLSGEPDVDGPVNAGLIDGVPSVAKFNGPQGIATDGTFVYIADTANNCIRRIRISDGMTLTIAGSEVAGSNDGTSGIDATFNLPIGIATDGTFLYVTDFASHVIRVIAGAPTAVTAANIIVTTIAGSAGTAGAANGYGIPAAQFNGPSGITTDGTNLYVSDYSGHTIRKIQ